MITPSGLAYDKLTAKDIVTVNVDDCSFEGDLAPSSEKGVHAAIYRERSDVGFIIHTHQSYASALSNLGRDYPVSNHGDRQILGDKVRYIPYALPGTKKLKNNALKAVAGSTGKAFLMAAHGAICIGADSEEAFNVAEKLEGFCKEVITRRYLELSGRSYFVEEEFYK